MLKLVLTTIALLFYSFCFSQTILEAAFIPVMDSMGNVVYYIKKSDGKEFNNPRTDIKIYCFNKLTDTIGYYYTVGNKRKYVSMLQKNIKTRLR